MLKQKQVRINSAFTAHEAEIKEMETNVKNLQVDMQNLNSLIAKNNRLQSILKEGNMDLENEFQNKLKVHELSLPLTGFKEAEREAISMEYQLSDAKEEKQDILHDIVEAEYDFVFVCTHVTKAFGYAVGKENSACQRNNCYFGSKHWSS